jgi:tRNA pseudouridine38-40 synthase
MMNTYKIIIAYDGTSYHGWQYQPHSETVAGVLQAQFLRVFNESIVLVGASRTDAGVHALGQVAHFSTSLRVAPDVLHRVWSHVLPASIYLRSLKVADAFFHAQRDVQEKTYDYYFFVQRPLPFFARYGLYYRSAIDVEKLEESLKLFVGVHDFRSFCTGYDQEHTIRSITSITVVYVKAWRAYRIRIKGPRFLRYMLRRIVGACLEVSASSEYIPSDLQGALAAKNPEQPFTTAPPHGLVLRKILYTKALGDYE